MLSMDKVKKTLTDNLIKLAKGMVFIDEIIEIKYAINDKGEEIAVEKKVRTTKRNVPPDPRAILELLDGKIQLEEKSINEEAFPMGILTKAQLKYLCEPETREKFRMPRDVYGDDEED